MWLSTTVALTALLAVTNPELSSWAHPRAPTRHTGSVAGDGGVVTGSRRLCFGWWVRHRNLLGALSGDSSSLDCVGGSVGGGKVVVNLVGGAPAATVSECGPYNVASGASVEKATPYPLAQAQRGSWPPGLALVMWSTLLA